MSAASDLPMQDAGRQPAIDKAFDVIIQARHALRDGTDVKESTAIDYGKKVKLVLDEFAAVK